MSNPVNATSNTRLAQAFNLGRNHREAGFEEAGCEHVALLMRVLPDAPSTPEIYESYQSGYAQA